ncbi:hypothetical protein AB0F88_10975 [Streptosporangium sp. NPDC023963]|uniref:hypothetical protein n=1 Tax=Streptosporangium sp. NPDC023963 TaxID=3155608 RepID=UPI0034407BF3
MGTTKETPSLAELRQRILDGGTVSPEEYAQAQTLAEIEELQVLADQKAAAQKAKDDHRDHVRAVKATVIDAEAAVDDQADLATIRAATVRIIGRHLNLAKAVRTARADLMRLKVPAGEDIEGIGWHEAGMGIPDSLMVDGRRHSITANPGVVIAAALSDACSTAGSSRHLEPQVRLNVPPKPYVETDEQRQERLLRAEAMKAKLRSEATAE